MSTAFNQEKFLVPRLSKAETEFSVSWAYPNSYAVGMTGLGYQLIWWLLEQNRDIEVRRVFTDLQEEGWQKSELFGFTLSWELDYVNVLKLLKLSGCALRSADRSLSDPLVFGGGPVLAANPEPFADFFDVILIGDAEIMLPKLLEAWREARRLPDKEDRLAYLSQIEGIYVPSRYSVDYVSEEGPIKAINHAATAPAIIKKQAFVAPADYVAHSVILTEEGSWGDKFLIELARSCPQECRFCLASYLTRPFRSANIDTVLAKIDMVLPYSKKIGLLGPSVTEHPDFAELAQALIAKKETDLEISVSSIRMDTVDPLILKMLVTLGQRSVTIALESGSERLRSIMKKNLSEKEIWQGMEAIAASGLESVKFYGIVGLPGETQYDLEETVRLLSELKKTYKRLRLVFGISSFVPKAQTPFQWASRDRESAKKIEYLRSRLAKQGIDIRAESHNWSEVQTFLSRADRRSAPLLLQMAEGEHTVGAWRRGMRKPPIASPDLDSVVYRQIPYDEILPWSHLVDEAKFVMLQKNAQAAEQLAGAIP